MSSRLTIAVIAFALSSLPAQAQHAAGTLRGKVVSHDGHPVVGAEVRIDGASATAMSDSSGRFEIRLARERARVQVRALGYTLLDTVLVLVPGESTLVTLRMLRNVQQLAPVITEAVLPYGKPMRYQHTSRFDDFYERRAKRPGTFFTREDIESGGRNTAFDLMSSVPGIIVSNRLDGAHIRIARCVGSSIRVGSRTPLAVFVNGQRIQEGLQFLAELKTNEIETMEVYRGPSQLPLEAMGDACAAVFITTRYTTGSVLGNK
jgi:hypothetical protein